MTMEEIDCLRNVDIMTVDPSTLVDRSTIMWMRTCPGMSGCASMCSRSKIRIVFWMKV